MFCCKGFGDENIDNLCNFNIFTKLHVWLLYTYQGIIHINLFCALGYHHLISNYIPDNYYMNLILTTIKYIVQILNKSNSNLKKNTIRSSIFISEILSVKLLIISYMRQMIVDYDLLLIIVLCKKLFRCSD